jgi:outer membrane protein assembly factor BamB
MAMWIRIGMIAALTLGATRVHAQDWPQWRGPDRDNKVIGFKTPAAWPKELTEKWSKSVGEGVSSPVLAGGKIYILNRQGDDEVTTCLDADTGSLLWDDKVKTPKITGGAAGGGKFAGARSTPAVAEGKVCTLGATGIVSCLDAATGKLAWRIDTKTKPVFFTSSSPLVTDGKCVVYADGLTAYDLADGAVQWNWPSKAAPYGSPVLMTVAGVKQVVTPTPGAVVGIGLADGKLLWKFDFGSPDPFSFQGNSSTPIVDGQTVIYGAAGGKGGASGTVAYKIEKQGDDFVAMEQWKSSVAPYQYNTPVLKDGFVFGLSSGKNFYCMDAKSGKEVWKDKTSRGETGGILNAGSVILALTANTGLIAFEPTDKGYSEVAAYKLSEVPGYSYPIVSGNRVYVKGESDLTLWTIE